MVWEERSGSFIPPFHYIRNKRNKRASFSFSHSFLSLQKDTGKDVNLIEKETVDECEKKNQGRMGG